MGGGQIMKNRKCKICGADFETEQPNRKYCGLSCREAGRIYSQLKRKDKNPAYFTEYMRKYRRERKKDGGTN